MPASSLTHIIVQLQQSTYVRLWVDLVLPLVKVTASPSTAHLLTATHSMPQQGFSLTFAPSRCPEIEST